MKKGLILPAVLVFLLNTALVGQEPAGMPPEGENATEQNKEKEQTAEELYPYAKPLGTPIDRREYAVSLQRTEEIAKRVQKAFLLDAAARAAYVKQPAGGGEVRKFDEKEIRAALEEQISKEVLGGKSVNPAGKPLDATRLNARSAVQEAVHRKFPKSEEQLQGELVKEAEQKYPLAKKGDKVTVQYTSGRFNYRISGTFYGYGIRGKSIMINSRSVAVRDLSAQDIPKFSKPDNEAMRKRYVETKLRKYQDEKFKYEKQLSDRLLQKQIAENDGNGFIFYGLFKVDRLSKTLQAKYRDGTLLPEERLKGCVNEWTSADRIISDMADGMIRVTRKRIDHERKLEERRIAEEKRRQQEEEEKKRQEESNKKPDEENPDAKEETPPNE
ncbi:MAG: hypothetical protein J6A21_00605 [Lentisphaeria bacterium]|nr:hypothetical protein [Lentisphaeria bacterium]